VEGHPHRKNPLLKLEDLTESFEPIVGQAVTLRALRREDHDVEHAFVSGLSPDTRHNRLLGGAKRITREYIESLTTIDYSRDMAIAATVMLEGEARYVRVDADRCEFAIVLADAWQGRGIGKRLLERLAAVARSRGLKEIYGDVLSTNRPMLEMCRRLGYRLGRGADDPTLTRVTLALV
jgi:acetyltransferase